VVRQHIGLEQLQGSLQRRDPTVAKLGTPENPEIIEPGQRPRPTPARATSRLGTALRLIKTLVVVVAPAVLLDYALFSMLHQGWRDQNALAFLLGLLLVPMAALASTLALLAGPLLLLSLVFLSLGRAVSFNARPLGRFGGRFKLFN
jgi:hypothetical protein